jgi:hypothetical protein
MHGCQLRIHQLVLNGAVVIIEAPDITSKVEMILSFQLYKLHVHSIPSAQSRQQYISPLFV